MKKIVAGVDEVGRGSLIGPVYAAAVILNPKINKKEIKDSKKVKKIEREKLYKYIKKNSIWAIGSASIREIEKLNFDIEIDGGINFDNCKIAIEAGANILVSGTTVFKSNDGDIKKNINLLKTK